MSTTAKHTIRNGVDTEKMFATLDLIKAQPGAGAVQFRATNRWIDGAHNRSTIKGFYAAGGEDTTRGEAFVIDAGEPAILLGSDTGANPAEYLLHALAACLTTSIVYVAAARRVELTSVESTLTGDMDVRGALGVDDELGNGFEPAALTPSRSTRRWPGRIGHKRQPAYTELVRTAHYASFTSRSRPLDRHVS